MAPGCGELVGNCNHGCYDIRYFLLYVSSHHQDLLIKTCSHDDDMRLRFIFLTANKL